MNVVNLAVTGPRGSGKSRIIRSLLAEVPGPSALFETVPLIFDDRVQGYGIRGPDGVLHPFAHESWYLHPRYARYGYDVSVFDNISAAIEEAIQSSTAIALDELGVMEDAARQFRMAVLAVVSAEVPALLAIKEKSAGSFIREVVRRQDVKVWSLRESPWEKVRLEMSEHLALLLGPK